MMEEKSWFKKLLERKIILGVSVSAGLVFMAIGVIFWGGFNWALEATNTEEFCISCHEMRDTVYPELQETVHYSNRSGVRATCPDCHVPKTWVYKMKRKIQASSELWHKMLGTIDTPEKFEEKRLQMAMNEWQRMKKTDSRECRNCHSHESMHQRSQKPRALKQHTMALQEGFTCIDCHKGIAHKNVRHQLSEEELEELEAPDPSLAKPEAALHLFASDIEADRLAAIEAEKEKARKAEEAKRKAEEAAKKAAEAAAAAKAEGKEVVASVSDINWAAVEPRKVTLFYPGTSSIEWIHGRKHGGKRAFTKGDRCVDCHDEETADMGEKIVTGEKLEDTPIPGKRGSIPVDVQAATKGDYLHMRFTWPDTAHAPAPGVDGGKMDPKNQVKIAMMFGSDDVEFADRSGCWGSCHDDVDSMPGEVDQATMKGYGEIGRLDISGGLTKYIKESRTDLEMKGRRGKKLGGWDKLKSANEVEAELTNGKILDLIRYQVGTKKVEDGYILDERKMKGGQGAEFTAKKDADNNWVVEMKRKLKSNAKGDVSIEKGTTYNFGFAIHDDYSDARFHHVSLGYRMAIEDQSADINVIKQ